MTTTSPADRGFEMLTIWPLKDDWLVRIRCPLTDTSSIRRGVTPTLNVCAPPA